MNWVKVNTASAAEVTYCKGNYSVGSQKITPYGSRITPSISSLDWASSDYYWQPSINLLEPILPGGITNCGSSNNEIVRVDGVWHQFDCNGGFLGTSRDWEKRWSIFPAWSATHTKSCLNISNSSCNSTTGCSLVTETLPDYGSCKGEIFYNPGFFEQISLSDYDKSVRVRQFAISSVMPGDVFNMFVYSFHFQVKADASDTPKTIADKLISSINAKSLDEWRNNPNFSPFSDSQAYTDQDSAIKYPMKPVASSGGYNPIVDSVTSKPSFVITPNFEKQFQNDIVHISE